MEQNAKAKWWGGPLFQAAAWTAGGFILFLIAIAVYEQTAYGQYVYRKFAGYMFLGAGICICTGGWFGVQAIRDASRKRGGYAWLARSPIVMGFRMARAVGRWFRNRWDESA